MENVSYMIKLRGKGPDTVMLSESEMRKIKNTVETQQCMKLQSKS